MSDPTATPATQATRDLAAQFVARAQALGLKGRRADDAAVEFFLGAYAYATLRGDDAGATSLSIASVAYVAPRGMAGVRELAAKA